MFSAIIIDKAGQATEPETLAAIGQSASFVVLAGDHKQLGPVVCCNEAQQGGLNISLLERLFQREPYINHKTGVRDDRFCQMLLHNLR